MEVIGRVAAIHVAAGRGAVMRRCRDAFAEVGRGLAGDRYHAGVGTFSGRRPITAGARDLSILDTETLAICRERLGWRIEAAALRRNLLVDARVLHELDGCECAIGGARIVFAGRCAPCGYLSRLLGGDMKAALHGVGGMRAAIVASGTIAVGDTLRLIESERRRRGLPR